MIRVTMISQDYLPRVGGAEKQIAALAPLLKKRGVEVQVLTRRHPGLAPFEFIDGVPIYRLPILRTKALASFTFTLSALPVIRRLRPDIVHAHGLLSPTTTAILAKNLFGMPVVSKSLRGGMLGDFSRLAKKPLGRQRVRSLQKHVDAFIVISNEIKQELIESGVAPERCIFIPNGVSLNAFQPVDENRKNQLRTQLGLPAGFLVIFVGRLEREKRVDGLIQVWPEIQKRNANAHLLILGTGSQEPELRQMATGSVLFGGMVENVPAYLQAADVFVLPSVAEGLSNALLEALATGLPVVATATGGTTDIVRHKVTGWLIHNYNSQNLSKGILALMDDAALREKCALEGRRYVVENYSLISTAEHLFKLYNSVLE
jgi:glycosyltransferase involved in cell wall biosynthesis